MRNNLSNFIMAIAAVVLCSCSVYRKYERPEVDVPSFYRDVESADTVSFASLPWRQLFTDPQLQRLIDSALVRNTDLNVARLKVTEARAALLRARLACLPSVDIKADASIAGRDGDGSATAGLTADASLEIDIFGKLTNSKRGAAAALESADARRQDVRCRVIATVATAYYNLELLDARLDLNNRSIESWRRTVKTLAALKKAGRTNEAAVLQAEANVMTLESKRLSLEKSIRETENAVYALTAAQAYVPIGRGSLVEACFPASLSAGIPLQTLARRPDVCVAERNLAQAFYATNAARAAFYPSINLGGSVGWTGSNGALIADPGRWLLNAILTLVQPMFNRGLNMANLRIAEAQQEEAVLLFRQALLDAAKEVNDAIAAWQTANGRLAIADTQVETLKETVRKTKLLMQNSSTTYLEVLTAEQSLLDAEESALQSRYDIALGVISLYHALGGGRD